MVMSKKKVGFWIDDAIAKRLDAASRAFQGNKGEIVDAALMLFFKAKDDEKRSALREVMVSKADRLVDSLAVSYAEEEVDDDDEKPPVTQNKRRKSRQGGDEP